jgi:hypothetical protein
MDTNQLLARRADEFQELCEREFRDGDGLLMCIHESGRALEETDLDEYSYNRPPYAGNGRALWWWRYENTNWALGEYLTAQANRARAGQAAGIRAGREMLQLLFEIYFKHARLIERGLIGKPIVEPGGFAAYNVATETNHDQMYSIFTGLWDYHPFARPHEQRKIEQMIIEIADFYRVRNYAMAVRGRVGTFPDHSAHGNKPMLFLLMAHRFAPHAGFYQEYLRWFEMNRQNPAVNATCLTHLYWSSATGKISGDGEFYYQGVWNMYIDVVARLTKLDSVHRDMFRSHLRLWWEETEPFLREDGRINWSLFVTPETRRWREIRPDEVEELRGPYSCWWGAPVLFSGQWAATIPVSILEHAPEMRARLLPPLLNILEKTDREHLKWCWTMDGFKHPKNIRVGKHAILPPVMWLYAYWRARAMGLINAL